MRAFLLLIGLAQIFLGQSWAKTITAIGGTSSAVQTAIDGASAGDIVMIPAGNFTWDKTVSINKAIKLSASNLGSTTITNGVGSGIMLVVGSAPPFGVEISNLRFIQGTGNGTNWHMLIQKPSLVHDCYFETAGKVRRSIMWETNGGVIWNCTFYSNGSDDSAIAFQDSNGSPNGVSPSWTTNNTLGTQDTDGKANTYLEDCTFKEIYLQALDFSDNSRTVMRHCRFENSAITSHGLDTGPYGARQFEIYDNTFVFDTKGTSPSGKAYPLPMDYTIFVRGGTGVIFNNVIPDMNTQMWGNKAEIKLTVYNIRRKSAYIPCQTKWQAIHQVGQGYKDGALVVDPLYLWGNSGGGNYDNPGLSDYDDECGNGQFSKDYIRKDRDYLAGTARPGYTPYAYPHPLRTGSSTPQPTPEPTATPNPTPAPTATPEPPRPTPTPTQTWEKWMENLNDWIRANPPYPDQR